MKAKRVLAALAVFIGTVIGACVLTGCEASSSEEGIQLKYLAVQFEDGDNWSIIDGDGKVLVDREYAADNEISKITNSGVYWVKQGEKFQLYSIDSPKNPLTDEEYDGVTVFADGVAFASKKGEPIYLIDEKGKVVKQMGREIAEARTFHDGMALVENQDGLWGYANTKGENVIQPKIIETPYLQDFRDGYVVVVNENSKIEGKLEVDIIDKQGNVTFSTKGSKYTYFSNLGHGRFSAMADDKYDVINSKGEVVLQPKKHDFSFVYYHKEGLYETYTYATNYQPGVLNEEGESLIRLGKYEELYYIKEGVFAAKRGDKWAYIDKDDNALTEFEYSKVGGVLGNSYIVKQGSQFFLLDSNFKEIKNTEYFRDSAKGYSSVRFIDVASVAEAIVKDLSPQGYKPFTGKTTAEEVCKAAGIGLDDIDNYQYSLELPSFTAGKNDFSVTARFTERMKTMRYHTETGNNGWYNYERQVEDGMGWNSESELRFFLFFGSYDSKIGDNDMLEAIVAALEKKGFKQRDKINSLIAKNGSQQCLVEFVNENGNLRLALTPSYKEEEEEP